MTSLPPQSTIANELQKLYSEYKSEHGKADILCKRVQLFRQEAGIPAINELRYAGHHFLATLDDNGSIFDKDQLRRAKAHAQRACYEAAEAGLVLALKEIKLFRDDYNKVIVTGDVKDYVQILKKTEEAKQRLGVPRKSGDDQQLDHDKHVELFDYLSDAASTLDAARPEINKRMRESRTTKRRWIIALAVSIIGIGVAFNKDRLWAAYDSLHLQGAPKANIAAPSTAGNPALPSGPRK